MSEERKQHPVAPKTPAVMQPTPWDDELARRVSANFPAAIHCCFMYLGQPFFVVVAGSIIPLLDYLNLEEDFIYLVDVTAVDYPDRPQRFDLIYVLYSYSRNQRIRVKAQIALRDRPQTATTVFAAANWLEREVFDMFGIEFQGHPDMRRILLPEEWQGFPLRKDSSILAMDNQWVRENLGIESGQ